MRTIRRAYVLEGLVMRFSDCHDDDDDDDHDDDDDDDDDDKPGNP